MITGQQKSCGTGVVPHEGTWIEIIVNGICNRANTVVPHEGKWIEILSLR